MTLSRIVCRVTWLLTSFTPEEAYRVYLFARSLRPEAEAPCAPLEAP